VLEPVLRSGSTAPARAIPNQHAAVKHQQEAVSNQLELLIADPESGQHSGAAISAAKPG
jgi:hypothetical protein